MGSEVRDFREGQQVFVRRTAGNFEQWTVVGPVRGRIMVANRSGDTKRYDPAVLGQVQEDAARSGMLPSPSGLLEWWAGLAPTQRLMVSRSERLAEEGHRPEVPGFVRGQGTHRLFQLAMGRISRLDRWAGGMV